MTNARRIALNLATLVPGVASIPPVRAYLAKRRTGTRGTDSARYCYTVWMRHLVMASRSGLLTTPRIIAELGPGDSLGTGIAGLLCGASRYYAFDVVEHASTQRNVAILRALVPLFRDRAAIPDAAEFPRTSIRGSRITRSRAAYSRTSGSLRHSSRRGSSTSRRRWRATRARIRSFSTALPGTARARSRPARST